MPSTYTSNNKIQKITTGEQSGTWGATTNTNFDLFDTAIDGFVSVSLSGTTHTLNIPDGSAGDGRNKVLVFTGSLSGANTVTVTPNTVKKHYFVQNNTTGGQNVIIAQGSGSTVTVKPGYSSVVYLDGAGSGAAVKEVLTGLKLTALIEATGAVLVGSSSGSTTLQASATASGTLTLPAATDTLVGKATTDTLTNKTFDTAGTGNVFRINGTQVSAVTGSGAAVLATSPTITTPTITTSATAPVVIGGTNTTSTLTLRSTSGVGATGADIIFQAGNNGATEVMRLQNGGNVGIGTSSPAFLLDAAGSCRFGNVVGISGGDTTPTQIGVLTFGQSTTSSYAWIQSWSSRPLAINPSGNNVGIGTSSPAQKLDVVGNLLLSGQSTAEQYIKVGYSRSGNGYSYIDLVGDTTYAPGTRLIRGNTGANAISSLEHRGTGDLRIVNYEAAPICFYTSSSEKVRIDSSGNVSINTSTSGSKLQVVGTTSLGSGSLNSFGSGFNVTVTGDYGKATALDNTNLALMSNDALVNQPLTMTMSVVGDSTATSRYGYISINEYSTGNWRNLALQPFGGNVGIGTSSPATSARLEIAGTTGALLVPRLTTTQRNALTAVNGMIIYNTTTNTMQGYINGAWADM